MNEGRLGTCLKKNYYYLLFLSSYLKKERGTKYISLAHCFFFVMTYITVSKISILFILESNKVFKKNLCIWKGWGGTKNAKDTQDHHRGRVLEAHQVHHRVRGWWWEPPDMWKVCATRPFALSREAMLLTKRQQFLLSAMLR